MSQLQHHAQAIQLLTPFPEARLEPASPLLLQSYRYCLYRQLPVRGLQGQHRPRLTQVRNAPPLPKMRAIAPIYKETAVTKRYLEDFAVGQTFGSGRVRVDKERIKTFDAKFDPQPFHLDEEA